MASKLSNSSKMDGIGGKLSVYCMIRQCHISQTYGKRGSQVHAMVARVRCCGGVLAG